MHRSRIASWLCVAATACAVTAGCSGSKMEGSGSVELMLSLPPTGMFRPIGMTTVSVTVTEVGGQATVSTTPIQMDPSSGAMSFATADVSVGKPINIAVELRDTANRIVGYGATTEPITPLATTDEPVTIPVRKPFVYVASDQTPQTLDSTLDASSTNDYQGMLAGSASTAIAALADGTEIEVFGAATLTRFGTTDHKQIGSAIPIPGGGVTDAAPVPGENVVVAAGATGLVIVDIMAGSASVIAMPAGVARPDRVAVGVDATGAATAYVLSGRIAPTTGMTNACAGAVPSQVTAIPLATTTPAPMTNSEPLAAIAANGSGVWGADPCPAGGVWPIGVAQTKPLLAFALGSSTIAIQGSRVWTTGTVAPQVGDDPEGAGILLASIDTDGTNMQQVALPPKAELITYDDTDTHELSINMHADTEVALDMAILPGAEYAAIIARQDTMRDEEVDTNDSDREVTPAMTLSVYDVMLVDPQTGALAQHVRATCDLVLGKIDPDTEFPDWSCGAATANELPVGAEFVPAAVAALFGDR